MLTTPTPASKSQRAKRRSITPSKSSSPNPPPDDECGSAHNHKRCSCFNRPPRPPPESFGPLPGRFLRKKTSSASMSGNSPNYSSSPLPIPSTPDRPRNGRGKSYNFEDSFSTTPAGPPPSSSAESSTPAGPPPSSYLGSSMIPQPMFGSSRSEGSGRSLQFGTPVGQTPQLPKLKPGVSQSFKKPIQHGIFSSPSAKRYNQQKKEPSSRGPGRNTSALQPNDFFRLPTPQDEDEDEDEDEEMEETDESYDLRDRDILDRDEEQDEGMDVNIAADFRQSVRAGQEMIVEGDYDPDDEFLELAKLAAQVHKSAEDDDNSDLLLPTPGRSRGKLHESNRLGDSTVHVQKEANYDRVARDMYKGTEIPSIYESDDVVLETEELVMKIYDALRGEKSEEVLARVINEVSSDLVACWDKYQYLSTPSITDDYELGIGPDPAHSSFSNANFLASLLLQLHAPPMPSTAANFGVSRLSFRASSQPQATQKDKPVPGVLLEWIEKHHNPLPSLLNDLHRNQPSPSASKTFWKDIQSGLLRGKVKDVSQILKVAGWDCARETGNDSLHGSVGFSGQYLMNIEKEVKALVNILEEHCPGSRNDWNTHSSDWKLFRLRAENAFGQLKDFAEGGDRDSEYDSNSTYGHQSFALQSRKAQSKIPWPVYQNLKVLYEIISGSDEAIVESAADWCEATVGLMAWWDETKADTRVVLGRSHFGGENGDSENYLKKLKRSVRRVAQSSKDFTGFQVNDLNPIEVGLACVFKGDIEASIGMIRMWSLPLSSAVAEIAAMNGWLPRTEPRSLITMQTFDAMDLEVLGMTGPNDRNDGIKDNTLNIYASSLASYHRLESKDLPIKIVRDSWELAIAVLGRLDDASRSEESVGKLLPMIPIESTDTLDKLLELLSRLGLTYHAEKQAEIYAQHSLEETSLFGQSLWYFARAHNAGKVKDVLNILFSYCLLESRSFPSFEELDPYLVRLISDKQATLEELEKVDSEASQLIQRYLSGYVVLRQYYDARDEQVLATEQKKIMKWQGTKNKAALQRLITLINSSADNIRGGLLDESCDAVVPVEFIIVLLGEVLPFISQQDAESIIAIQHIEVLLRAIEDMQTVSSRVYEVCNDFFKTVMASASGLKGSKPGDLMVSSTESGMGQSQSQFSLVGSSYAASQLRKSMSRSGFLLNKADVKRGWDWRKRLSSMTTAEDVLRVLRLGIAKELARCWIDEADGTF